MLEKTIREGKQATDDFESKFKLAKLRLREMEVENGLIKAEKNNIA